MILFIFLIIAFPFALALVVKLIVSTFGGADKVFPPLPDEESWQKMHNDPWNRKTYDERENYFR
jgi:hypothetical protein